MKLITSQVALATIESPLLLAGSPVNIDLSASIAMICTVVGVYLAIRKELRDNAEERAKRDKNLLEQIDSRIGYLERRLGDAIAEVKVLQRGDSDKLDRIDSEVIKLAVRLENHEKLPGHSASIQGIEDIKEMLRKIG